MRNELQVLGAEARIRLRRKSGPDLFATIDLADLRRVEMHPHRWCARWDRRAKRFYCYSRRVGGGGNISLHRFVLDAFDDPRTIDHIDGDGLNDRRSNLRLVSNAANVLHRTKLNRNNASGVRGVYWNARREKWAAQLKIDRRQIYLGLFSTKEEAAHAVEYARQRHPASVELQLQ